VNTYGLATTGFNSKSHDFIDASKQSHSHKYGKSSIIKNHACINVPCLFSRASPGSRKPRKPSKTLPACWSPPSGKPANRWFLYVRSPSNPASWPTSMSVTDRAGPPSSSSKEIGLRPTTDSISAEANPFIGIPSNSILGNYTFDYNIYSIFLLWT